MGMRPMSQPAKAHEPSMEEILASIRRIIADDDSTKGTAKPVDPLPPPPTPVMVPPVPPPPAPPEPAIASPEPAIASPEPAMRQPEVDDTLSGLHAVPPPPSSPPAPDILDLTEAMTAEPPAQTPFRTIDSHSDIVFEDHPLEP